MTALAERPAERTGSLTRSRAMADALADEAEQRRVLMEYIARHMVEGTDYGVIPGTERKDANGNPQPTPKALLKPGAEKLTELFRCTPRFKQTKCVEDWDKPLFFYEFECVIESRDAGVVLAHGVGSCNSRESKYRWRNADRKCPGCGAAAIKRSKYPPRNQPDAPPGWYCHAKAGGCGSNYDADDADITNQTVGRVENPDVADAVNSILKIAKKRALVDAAIALARCSDMFTQDVEDFDDAHPDQPQAKSAPRPRPAPQPRQETPFTLDDIRAKWQGAKLKDGNHLLQSLGWLESQLLEHADRYEAFDLDNGLRQAMGWGEEFSMSSLDQAGLAAAKAWVGEYLAKVQPAAKG